MKLIFELYLTFVKIGAISFGGGYAMLPILQHELIEARGWTTENELSDYFAISQCTPGVIAVNTATIIGYNKKGILGSIAATLGVITAPMIIITVIFALLKNFSDIEIVKNAFAGIRACVCVLIINAIIRLWKNSVKDKVAFTIFLIVLALSLFTDISSFILVLSAGIAGLIISAIRRAKLK